MSHLHLPNAKVWPVIGPAFAIVVLYLSLMFRPINRQLDEKRTAYHRLESVVSLSNAAKTAEQLQEIRDEATELRSALGLSSSEGEHLVGLNVDSLSPQIGTRKPAQAIAETIAAFERHGLQCIASTPPEELLLQQLGTSQPEIEEIAAQRKEKLVLREVTITIRGTFPQMQAAMRELSTSAAGIVVTALDMEDSDGTTALHHWTLKLLI